MEHTSENHRILKLDPRDNVLVALTPLHADETITFSGKNIKLPSPVPAKFKFVESAMPSGAQITMYGVTVGKLTEDVPAGGVITTRNLRHDTNGFSAERHHQEWSAPDVSKWQQRTFDGYHRADGQAGTRNYWLVLPLVFCENRNVEALREAFEEELGYTRNNQYRQQVRELAALHSQATRDDAARSALPQRLFKNLDGIKFLLHQGGCGGTREDARSLCGLLAGYIHHPNVAGATVLSLGCQNAEVSILKEEIQRRDPQSSKPVLIFDQQQQGLGSSLLEQAISKTFAGLAEANKLQRTPAPLSALTVALKCGGSDGFSGISANPALGHVSDTLVALGGKTILSEFPEL